MTPDIDILEDSLLFFDFKRFIDINYYIFENILNPNKFWEIVNYN